MSAFYFRSKTFPLAREANITLFWMIKLDAATVAQHAASFSKYIYDIQPLESSQDAARINTRDFHLVAHPHPISATHISPLWQPKSLPKAVGSTSRRDPIVPMPVFRGALPVSGPSHTSSTACQSSILASSTPGKQA